MASERDEHAHGIWAWGGNRHRMKACGNGAWLVFWMLFSASPGCGYS